MIESKKRIFTSNARVIVRRLNGSDPSPSLPVWATGEEAEGDHREELSRLHVLNLFSGRATEGGGNGKGNVPFVRNRTPGGRKWAGGL